jgi:hypothetical protein
MTLNRTRSLLCRDCAHPAIATHHFRNVDDSCGFFKTAAAGTAALGCESTVKRERGRLIGRSRSDLVSQIAALHLGWRSPDFQKDT